MRRSWLAAAGQRKLPLPRRFSMSPSCSSTASACRSVWRLTENCAASSCSHGSFRWPSACHCGSVCRSAITSCSYFGAIRTRLLSRILEACSKNASTYTFVVGANAHIAPYNRMCRCLRIRRQYMRNSLLSAAEAAFASIVPQPSANRIAGFVCFLSEICQTVERNSALLRTTREKQRKF